MGSVISFVLFTLAALSVARQYTRWKNRAGERALLSRLRRTPASLIVDAHEGTEVRIEGRVRLLQPGFETPCGRERCAVFEAEARERRDGCGIRLAHLVGRADFVVEDESGRAVIRVEAAKLLLYPTLLRQQSPSDMEPTIVDFLKQYAGGRLLSGAFLYSEAALRDGDFVQIVSRAAREAATDPTAMHTIREPAAAVVLRASPDAELIISSYSPHAISLFALPDRRLDQGALDAVAAPRPHVSSES